jgi:hypothetical protein
MNRLLQQVIPKDDGEDEVNAANQPFATSPKRPGFSLPLMSNNFRRFNARSVCELEGKGGELERDRFDKTFTDGGI